MSCLPIRLLAVQVREMPLVDFRDKYSGNINAVLTEDIDARIAASKVHFWPTTSA